MVRLGMEQDSLLGRRMGNAICKAFAVVFNAVTSDENGQPMIYQSN